MKDHIRAFAPAKVNLALHITGRRTDGYHLLDSLVVFATVGDWITAQPADRLGMTVSGEGARKIPTDGRNLMIKAARMLDPKRPAALHLEKNLPASSGIGGGSSDAAASLRALSKLWGLREPAPAETLALGADLPVCMAAIPVRMRGIGASLDPVPVLPPLHMVLVNPRKAVSTSAVFRHLKHRDHPPMADIPAGLDAASFAVWLGQQRNDLQAPATAILPAIGTAIAGLQATQGCLLARMSGSGATCFGLYAKPCEARDAAAQFRTDYPSWWVADGAVLDDAQSTRATT